MAESKAAVGSLEERYGRQGDIISTVPFDGRGGQLKCDWEATRTSLAASFDSVFDHFADRPCIGARGPAGDQGGDGAVEFQWFTYKTFAELSKALGAGLRKECGEKAWVGLFAANSMSWFLADFACLWAGLPSMPLWEAWDTSRLGSVLARYAVTAVFCDRASTSRVLQAAASESLPGLKFLFRDAAAEAEASPPLVPLKPIKDLLNAGSAALTAGSVAFAVAEPASDASTSPTHTVIFTSGTTGLPKGVVYSQRLWLRNMAHYDGPLTAAFSYMPLAFITDRHTVWTSFWNGGHVGLSAHGGDMDIVFRDLHTVQPTVLKGVPKFFEEVLRAARMAHDTALQILGGRTHTLVCGAGHLDPAVADFFRTCRVPRLTELSSGQISAEEVSVVMLSGYGSTEAGNLASNGIMSPHVAWRLQSLDGSGVLSDGVGALEVKTGDMMFSGYLDDPAATKAAFTEDGYYQMGDVVRMEREADGRFRVTVLGRVKSTAKLSSGKWVFLESLEDFYRSCPGSPEIRYVMVHGDPRHADLVAVVDLGAAASSHADADGLLQRLQAHAADAGKPAYEVVRQVILAHSEFSASADPPTLNGTGKLNRQLLEQTYQEDIEAAYHRIDELGQQELEVLDQSKSFKAQGGSSLQAARIASLYRRLNLPVSRAIRMLLAEDMTVGQVRLRLEQSTSEGQEPDERADAVLPEDVRPAGPTPTGKRRVLVTGATGFLGPFVVAALLAAGHEVTCLVRAINGTVAWSRVTASLAAVRLWDASASSRLQVVCGDVSPELGLEREAYEALANSVGVVVHLAAKVDLKKGYAYHRKINVWGTLSVLRFAALAGAHVVFASTTDGPYRPALEAVDAEPCDVETVHGGYSRSKWVGERLIAAAHQRGIPSCIARIGMVVGDSKTGRCNPNDVYCRLLIGFAHTASFPDVPPDHRMIRGFCADAAAAALASLADGRAAGLAIRCASAAEPLPLLRLREWLLSFGEPFRGSGLPLVPVPEWLAKAEADAALSAWPVVASGKATGEFHSFDRNGLEASYREDLAKVFGVAVLAKLEVGVSRQSLHAMLRFLFADVSAKSSWHRARLNLKSVVSLAHASGLS